MGIKAIKLMDKIVGAPLCYVLGLLKIPWAFRKPKRILVIQLWGIGETILTLPALEELRRMYPEAKIEALTTERNAGVYRDNPHVDRVHSIQTSMRGIMGFARKNVKAFSLVIDMEEYLNVSALIAYMVGMYRVGFSHGARSMIYHRKVLYNDKQHVVQTFLDLARSLGGAKNHDSLEKLKFSAADRRKVDALLRKNKVGKKDRVIGIAPGTAESAPCRMWPLERVAELADHLIAQREAKVLLIGTKAESGLVNQIIGKMEHKGSAIDLTGKVDLKGLFCLVTRCRLFIGNDSGGMHVAAAQGVPTIGLFGPNLPQRFGPYGKGSVGIYKGEICEFSPCINVHLGEVPDCLYPRASKDYQKCMKSISVGEVISEAERMLK